MNIDSTAALTARKETVIDAPLDQVWALQTDIDGWPAWQPDVTTARLEGALEAGTIFRWKAKGLNIVSTLQAVEPGRTIGWTGDSIGMRAVHIWHFEPQAGGTRVVTEESLSGWFPRLMKMFSPAFLENSLAASLQTLKTRAERR